MVEASAWHIIKGTISESKLKRINALDFVFPEQLLMLGYTLMRPTQVKRN